MHQTFMLLCEELKETLALMNINGEEKSTTNANLFSLFLENIINLGANSIRDKENSLEHAPNVRRCDKNVLQSLIQKKVKELKYMLQDSDYNEADPDDNLLLKTEDKTTIVELVSDGKGNLRNRESFKQSIRKYKRLRRVIYKSLINESVSNKTIHLIIRTIDEMIAKMIASRCSWKRNINERNVFRITDDKGENFFGIPAAWNSEWEKIKEKYSDLFQNNSSLPHKELNVVIKSLMEKLPSFFAHVSKDGEKLAKEYNVRCQKIRESDIIDTEPYHRNNFSINNFRHGNTFCKTKFRMCSDELKHFLMHVFNSIHKVTTKVLTDYFEMYKRDVNIDKINGQKGIVTILKEINEEVGNEVCTIYVNEIDEIRIDKEKNPKSHDIILLYLINNLTEKVIIHTNEINRLKLKPMDSELKERILKDIDVNMKMELGRLSDELKKTICPAFQTCNGRYTVKDSKKFRGNPDSVYVRVIVKMDDGRSEPNKKISKASFQINNPNSKPKNSYRKALSVTRTTTNYSNSSNVIKV